MSSTLESTSSKCPINGVISMGQRNSDISNNADLVKSILSALILRSEEWSSLFCFDLCASNNHGSFVMFRSGQSDSDISLISTSTMITS
jgi:hypothetical protein